MESILTSIKKLLGIEEDDVDFDTDIIIHINSALMRATTLGVGPSEGFRISDKKTRWSDFIGERKDLESIKDYVYLKVKLVFDPPQMGYLVEAINKQILEHEWILNSQIEIKLKINDDGSSGGIGTIDYNDLINKPEIESVTLKGNKTLEEIGLENISDEEIDSLFN